MSDTISSLSLWPQCLEELASEIPEDQFNTWIRPLQSHEQENILTLYAPNQFVLQWVKDHFLARLSGKLAEISPRKMEIRLGIGTVETMPAPPSTASPSEGAADKITTTASRPPHYTSSRAKKSGGIVFGGVDGNNGGNINVNFTFDNFVEGNSNRLARAAAIQVSGSPGQAYNPLFLYGGVGLGKTHLTHAMGNFIKQQNPEAKVVYLHSERFVADMIKALQRNEMDKFKKFYRSINCLLIDDIQFFANKERSQEEFFHTFNYLLDGRQQIVLTCDRYPKEIGGLEERLQSRFGCAMP